MPKAAGWFRRGTSTTATGTTSLSIALPTGVLDDDILVMVLAHQGAGYATVPAGWTLIEQDVSGACRGEMYWKRASSEAGPYSVTGLATAAAGVIQAYGGGLLSGDVVNVSSVGTSAASAYVTAASVTVTHPRALVLAGCCTNANDAFSNIQTRTDIAVNRATDDNISRLVLRANARTAAGASAALGEIQKIVAGATGVLRGALASASSPPAGAGVGILVALIPETAAETSGTRYYLSTKRPQTELTGPLDGAWDATEGPSNYGDFPNLTPYELSQTVSDAGRAFVQNRTSNVPNSTQCLQRWVTPLLAAQTVSGTIDVLSAIGQLFEDRTSGAITIPDVYSRLHVYITSGDTLAVRHVLLDEHTDTAAWPFSATPRWNALNAPVALTSGAALEGDRICIEFGLVAGTFATPTPLRPPEDYGHYRLVLGTQTTEADFGSLYCSGTAFPDGLDDNSLTQTFAPFVSFSATLTELGTADPVPANTTCATAVSIASLPYTAGPVATRGSATPNCAVWYAWTSSFTGTVVAHSFGSQFRAWIDVYTACDLTTATTLESNSVSAGCGYGIAAVRLEVETSTTYYFRVTQDQDARQALSNGGVLRFAVLRVQPPANDDVILPISGFLLRYSSAGVLVDLTTQYVADVTSGIAIDYTERPMDSFAGGVNTSHRLACMSFTGAYVNILDLTTWDLVDLIFDPIPRASSSDWDDGGLRSGSSISITAGGELVMGWWGNGFTRVAGDQASFLLTTATTNSADITTISAVDGDSQAGAPFPDVTRFAAALDVGGVNYLEVASNQDTVYYTSGGWYLPIGGQTVKRYSLTSGQLADFGTIAAGPGPNPGVKGLFPLSDGTVLVCNGGQVVRLSPGGTIIQTYTGTDSERSVSFADVEPLSNGTQFWALEEYSGTLYKFDLNSSAPVLDLWTYAGFGASTSIVTYRTETPAVTYGTRDVVQRRLRRAPHLSAENAWLRYRTFQIDMRTGVGLSSGQGSDPQIMLRWSNDGGHTWSNEHWTTAGRMGKRRTRALWRQLGRARNRTFEVSVSDPVAWELAAAYIDVEPGNGS